jgi:membrane-bound lytic murein transglycosylase B
MGWTSRAAILLAAALVFLHSPGAPGYTDLRAQSAPAETPQPFADWLAALMVEARVRGFSDALLNETVAELSPLDKVLENDRAQAELNPGFRRYLSTRLTSVMVDRGKELSRQHSSVLAGVEKEFQVQRRFLLAIWGLETRYGRITGNIPVFQALATLAWEPRRAAFFRAELFDALTMVQRGHIEAGSMTGSWAGAMGQPQFTPSSYLKHAVDFDGDGRRDIWKSTGDALASMANYLKASGWNGQQTWGREVRLTSDARTSIERSIPKRTEGCYARRNMTERRPLKDWQKIGVRLVNGNSLPAADLEAGLVDVGERTFLVYPNYDAILAYNCAHYYALTVALLSERLR